MFYDTLWVLCRTLGVALFGIRFRFAEPLPTTTAALERARARRATTTLPSPSPPPVSRPHARAARPEPQCAKIVPSWELARLLYSSLETWGFDTVKDVARKRTPWNVLEEINESLGRYGFRIQLVRSETHAGAVYAAFVNTRDDALAKDVKPCAPELYAGFKALLEALGDADAGHGLARGRWQAASSHGPVEDLIAIIVRH
jgi:hypothetical protein